LPDSSSSSMNLDAGTFAGIRRRQSFRSRYCLWVSGECPIALAQQRRGGPLMTVTNVGRDTDSLTP
jgi:hypothetical protein